MEALASLGPWGFVFLGIFLIMWAIKEFVAINSPIYRGVMAILAILAGIIFILAH